MPLLEKYAFERQLMNDFNFGTASGNSKTAPSYLPQSHYPPNKKPQDHPTIVASIQLPSRILHSRKPEVQPTPKLSVNPRQAPANMEGSVAIRLPSDVVRAGFRFEATLKRRLSTKKRVNLASPNCSN